MPSTINSYDAMTRLRVLLIVFLLPLVLLLPAASAQTLPVTLQGRLTTPDGTPVPDGPHQLDLRLYRQAGGGTAFWQEAHTVETTGGLFSLMLGSEHALDPATFAEATFLALTIDGEDLPPRLPLSAVPVALRAGQLDVSALEAGTNISITESSDGRLRITAAGGSGGGGGLSFVTSDGTLEGEGTSGSPLRLAEGAVEGEHLAEGALVAGANVMLRRQGDGALEIAASGGGGLERVESDATLAGEGTAGAPLQVAVPLVLAGADDDGVVQGAHSNGNRGQLGGNDYGAYGEHNSGNRGWFGSSTLGAYGSHANGHSGILGGDAFGVRGEHTNGNRGYVGGNNYGVTGSHTNGHRGWLASSGSGVVGQHANGNIGGVGTSDSGLYGEHTNGTQGWLGTSNRGAYAENANGNRGLLAGNAYGAYGQHSNGHWGALGSSNSGVFGEHANGHWGRLGDNTSGVQGLHTNGNSGRLGAANAAVLGDAASGSLAGRFLGDVSITGTLSKGGGAFKIDHPLDPEGQYLAHSFVESPDMMNVYNGNVVTDAGGEAVVELPSYFEALNRDFRYQLTVIGTFAQAIIAEEIQGNRFVIRTDQPGVKVSWQVTGIRQDAWAEAHRIVVEEAKPAVERGFYLHPQLYGQPEARSVAWARDPEGLRTMQEWPAQIEAERRQMDEQRQQLEAKRQQRPPRPHDGQQ